MAKKIHGFIFDMDGIIIDSEPVHSKAKMDTFAHYGIPFQEKDLIHYMGMNSHDGFQKILKDYHCTDIPLQEMIDYKHHRYMEVLKKGDIQPIAGTVDLIKQLYATGMPLALATSSWRPSMETVLSRFGISDYFQVKIAGDEVKVSKPDPTIYLLAAKGIGVKPEDCAVLEDTKAGITAAKRAGMYCIAYHNPNSGNQDLSDADWIVEHISDIRVEHLLDKK